MSAEVTQVSCGSAGNCATGGGYWDSNGHPQGFVVSLRNGRWGTATGVPGLGALNAGGAEVNSVSCGSAGNCAAGGSGFVAVERDGAWGTATGVPGLGALNAGGAARVTSVSCPLVGTCAAGGDYADRHHHSRGFVVSQTG